MVHPRKEYLTSHDTIHHLFHLAQYESETGTDLGELNSVAEWGGGYGNLAKIIFRSRSKLCTHLLIDIPLLCCLQWLYLSTTLGKENAHLVREPNEGLREGVMNVIPVSLVDRLDIHAELFISTWALSESSVDAQDFVSSRRWFGARHLLLAYQESNQSFTSARKIGQLACQAGAAGLSIDFLPGNFYAFL